MTTFNPSSSHPDRAVQAWLILVSAAKNRQTLTYEGLSLLMYRRKAQRVPDKPPSVTQHGKMADGICGKF